MKKTNKKLISALLCALIAASALSGCASSDTEEGKESSSSQTEQTGSPTENDTNNDNHDITEDTYKEQITYYMSLSEVLQAELLKLKEEGYIEACEYQMKIEALEATVEALRATVNALSNGGSPSINTQSPGDMLSASSSYKYSVSEGRITITGYVGKETDIKIPSSIDGMKVVKIGEGAFKGTNIKSAEIPKSVSEIDWFAFSSCPALTDITIPSSVEVIGYGAFENCRADLTLHCEKDSYAEAYAKSFALRNVID